MDFGRYLRSRFEGRVGGSLSFSYPISREAYNLKYGIAGDERKHAPPEFAQFASQSLFASIFGGLVGLVVGFVSGRVHASETLRDAKISKGTAEGFRLWRAIISRRTVEGITGNAIKFGGFAALFSATQLSLGIWRERHDLWHALVAGAFTGAVVGSFQGSRGLRFGLLYGAGAGLSFGLAELALRSAAPDGNLLAALRASAASCRYLLVRRSAQCRRDA